MGAAAKVAAARSAVAALPETVRAQLGRLARGEPLVTGVAESQRDAIYGAAYAALAAGRTRQAAEALCVLLALEPHGGRAWGASAIVLEREGDVGSAAAVFAIAASLEGSAALWLRSAECALAAGHGRDAVRAATHAVAMSATNDAIRRRAERVIEEASDERR